MSENNLLRPAEDSTYSENPAASNRPGYRRLSIKSQKMSPQLGGVPETLLIPLWARAEEQKRPDPIIVDPEAVRIVQELDYDFDNFRRKRVETENFCVRSRVMDEVIAEILSETPGRTVVEFGPGLDTRSARLGHLAGQWLEVDLPEVIELRRRFFSPGPECSTVACSMTEDAWKEEVPVRNFPPLFIAEGVFYFFSAEQIRTFLSGLKQSFPDCDLVFDAISSWFLKFSNMRHPLASSRMQFSLQPNASDLPSWDPDFAVEKYVGYGDSPYYDGVMNRFSWWKRAAVRAIPIARHAFMVVHTALKAESKK